MQVVHILGIPIHVVTKSRALEFIEGFIAGGKPHQITTVNNEFIVEAQHNQQFRGVLNQADLSLADSTGVTWAAKRLGRAIERIPGADLVQDIAKLAETRDYKFYLVGGAPGVAEQAAKRLNRLYPRLLIVGAEEGVTPRVDALSVTPRSDEVTKLIGRIKKVRPDILLVAFGAPKQDLFIAAHKDELGVPVMIGVGGTLDFLAGRAKRAPKIMRRLGLEWFWRLLREPRRFARIWRAVVVFPLLVLLGRKS